MKNLLITIITMASFTFADDVTDINNFIERHWQLQNDKNWSEFVSTLHSDGTMNGDSNGSFWYHQDATVEAVTKDQVASNKFDFNPRYIEVDVLNMSGWRILLIFTGIGIIPIVYWCCFINGDENDNQYGLNPA